LLLLRHEGGDDQTIVTLEELLKMKPVFLDAAMLDTMGPRDDGSKSVAELLTGFYPGAAEDRIWLSEKVCELFDDDVERRGGVVPGLDLRLFKN